MQPTDEERFTDFVRAHSASLFRTGYLMTGDYQRGEDLLQATLVRLYQRWHRIEAMENPLGYARKVLVNQATSWWQRRSSHEVPVLLFDEPSWGGGVDEATEHARVWQAILTLPPRQRAVLVLKYYEDLTEADIADTLGMAVGTVKSHSHAALHRLGELLEEPAVTSTEQIKGVTP
jgi:RNA polymerase sigma-70 factor (sigma-E family)